jgi:ketosteroid isomerase-like protein
VSEALRGAHLAYELISCEPVSMVVEDDNAATIVFTRSISRATGRSIQGMLAHFLRFRDGKIVEVREFLDSFGVAEQVLGREFL